MQNIKDFRIALFVGLLVSIVCSVFTFEAQCEPIRSGVLRMHVLANSDSEQDQALKYKVRDRLLAESETLFASCANEAQAARQARAQSAQLEAAARGEIEKNGFDYDVKVVVGPAQFDTREYGSYTLPAGEYEAVNVYIGSGEGQNWWCVMFPPICLPAAAQEDTMSDALDENSLHIVEHAEEYEMRFKTVELFHSIKNALQSMFQ